MSDSLLKIIRYLSYPFGWIYGLVVSVRNKLFDSDVIKSRTFKTGVIVVGNLTTGGTGKTPVVECLISILSGKYNVIELSRGYKRKSSGMVEAKTGVTAYDIGDEPYQIFRKFPKIKVVVDADRCHAIEEMEARYPETDVFILDDAFQHRYVNPGRSILLIDFNRSVMEDSVLPYGNLREPAKGRYRADIVIVTKCPANMNAFDTRVVKNELNLHAYQDLFFTTLKYSAPRRMSDGGIFALDGKNVLLVTSIASPAPLKEYLEQKCGSVEQLLYEDHHSYNKKDLITIDRRFAQMDGEDKIIVVTAKDEAKLISMDIPDEIIQYLYVIDVKIDFLFGSEKDFSKKIVDYVEKNKRNGVLFTE